MNTDRKAHIKTETSAKNKIKEAWVHCWTQCSINHKPQQISTVSYFSDLIIQLYFQWFSPFHIVHICLEGFSICVLISHFWSVHSKFLLPMPYAGHRLVLFRGSCSALFPELIFPPSPWGITSSGRGSRGDGSQTLLYVQQGRVQGIGALGLRAPSTPTPSVVTHIWSLRLQETLQVRASPWSIQEG